MKKITKKVLDDLKQSVNIVDIAESYGIKVEGGPERYKAICVFHGSDTLPSLMFYHNNENKKDSFHCFGCDVGSDHIDLITICEKYFKNKEITFIEAVKKLAEFSKLNINLFENENEDSLENLKSILKEENEERQILDFSSVDFVLSSMLCRLSERIQLTKEVNEWLTSKFKEIDLESKKERTQEQIEKFFNNIKEEINNFQKNVDLCN